MTTLVPTRLGLISLLVLYGPPTHAQVETPAVRGVVTDSAGQPLVNAMVTVRETGDMWLTAPDGIFAFDSLLSGLYTVRASLLGFLRNEIDSVRVQAGQPIALTFRMVRAPTEPSGGVVPRTGKGPAIRGVVTDTAGQPLMNVSVVVVEARDTRLTARDGTFAFDSLPSGLYSVVAAFIGFHRNVQDSVWVHAGETTTLKVRLVHASTIHESVDLPRRVR